MQEPEQQPTDLDRIAAAYGMSNDDMKRWAALLAERYDSVVHSLYQSDAGRVRYGRAHQVEDWDRYSKGWHRSHGPSRYMVAGVEVAFRIGSDGREPVLVMESTRSLVRSIPLPPPSAIPLPHSFATKALYGVDLGPSGRELYSEKGKRIGFATLSADRWSVGESVTEAEEAATESRVCLLAQTIRRSDGFGSSWSGSVTVFRTAVSGYPRDVAQRVALTLQNEFGRAIKAWRSGAGAVNEGNRPHVSRDVRVKLWLQRNHPRRTTELRYKMASTHLGDTELEAEYESIMRPLVERAQRRRRHASEGRRFLDEAAAKAVREAAEAEAQALEADAMRCMDEEVQYADFLAMRREGYANYTDRWWSVYHGFDPGESVRWLADRPWNPGDAKKWRDAGFGPEETRAIRASGIRLSQAAPARAEGVDAAAIIARFCMEHTESPRTAHAAHVAP